MLSRALSLKSSGAVGAMGCMPQRPPTCDGCRDLTHALGVTLTDYQPFKDYIWAFHPEFNSRFTYVAIGVFDYSLSFLGITYKQTCYNLLSYLLHL